MPPPSCTAPSSAAAVQDVLWYQQCANGVGSMMGSWGDGNYAAGAQCPTSGPNNGYRGLWLYSYGTRGGTVAHWEADAPGNIAIVAAHAPEMATNFPSYFYGGFFYWAGGNSGWLSNSGGGATAWPSASGWQSFAPSPYFGFELACNAATQCAQPGAWFDVYDLQLEAYEYQTPNIYAGPSSGGAHLWYQGGKWIRGVFPVDVRGTDPSGVCRMLVSWNGHAVQDSGERPTNEGFWDECDPNHVANSPQDFFLGATLDTRTTVPTSARDVQLALQAHNASYNPATGAPEWSSDVEYLNVDNEPVSLSLSGPTDASVAPGTQYLNATATAGPSGVGGIYCSERGGPWTTERLTGAGTQTATARIPVAGLGAHHLSCFATNRAQDASGTPAASPTQTWTLKIGEPVTAAISFSKVRRSCRRTRKRVHVGNHTRVEHVLVCHTLTRTHSVAHVPFGHGVTVSGWVSILDGPAIGHVPVAVMTAPDNGSYTWRRAALVNTTADGTFTASLRPGPSRVVEAVYGGGPVTESATSRLARLLVPAEIRLIDVPTRVPWGGSGVIHGRVLGGHIPPGAQILKLLVGLGGRHLRTIGNPDIRPDGRFGIRVYATGSGGPERLQVAVGTLRERDYPYSPGISRRVWITLG